MHLVATQQNKVFLLRSFWFYCRGFLVWLARPQARKSPKKSPGTGGRKKAALAPLLAPGAEAAVGTTASAPQAVQLGSGGARHAQRHGVSRARRVARPAQARPRLAGGLPLTRRVKCGGGLTRPPATGGAQRCGKRAVASAPRRPRQHDADARRRKPAGLPGWLAFKSRPHTISVCEPESKQRRKIPPRRRHAGRG